MGPSAFALLLVAASLIGLMPPHGCGAKHHPKPETKKIAMGRNVWLEIAGETRRVLIDGYVVLRAGVLEQLMCRKNTKEHEAILAADVDARDIHRALLLTGIEPGAPARYDPDYRPPSGPQVAVTLQYQANDKLESVAAQKWIRNIQDKKELKAEWVFVGSQFFPDPVAKNRPPIYAANGGDVICVANFEDALLDLSIKSSKDNSDLSFEAWTERIPPLETRVTLVLEPVAKEKSK